MSTLPEANEGRLKPFQVGEEIELADSHYMDDNYPVLPDSKKCQSNRVVITEVTGRHGFVATAKCPWCEFTTTVYRLSG